MLIICQTNRRLLSQATARHTIPNRAPHFGSFISRSRARFCYFTAVAVVVVVVAAAAVVVVIVIVVVAAAASSFFVRCRQFLPILEYQREHIQHQRNKNTRTYPFRNIYICIFYITFFYCLHLQRFQAIESGRKKV